MRDVDTRVSPLTSFSIQNRLDGPARLSPAGGSPLERRNRTLRVAVVNGDPVAGQALVAGLGDDDGFSCVGRYRTLEQARSRLPCAPADVLLVDLTRPHLPAAPGIRAVRATSPETAVITLVDNPCRARVFDLLCSGAVGCLLTPLPPTRLAMAIEDAASGGAPLSPAIARTVVDLFQRTGPPDSGAAALTPRERSVLTLLARGATYDRAACTMGITVNTVRNYVRSIYEKLHVHSKGAAVALAFRHGLL